MVKGIVFMSSVTVQGRYCIRLLVYKVDTIKVVIVQVDTIKVVINDCKKYINLSYFINSCKFALIFVLFKKMVLI